MKEDYNITYYNTSCLFSSKYIEDESVDLFFCDPPYYISGNSKKNNDITSSKRADWDTQWENKEAFYSWTYTWLELMYKQLKPSGSAYICICWEHSGKFHEMLEKIGFNILNRITWKRDKGRGSSKNWKSMHEDIWFVSKSKKYIFNVEEVKVKKEVVAPYKDAEGNPKDWFIDSNGKKIRYTYPGNIWVDFTVPFWSMKEVRSYAKTIRSPENTLIKHNTQKPKDLVKRCICASSNKGDLVVDYFAGSGTTALAALELERKVIVFDISATCISMLEKRLINEIN